MRKRENIRWGCKGCRGEAGGRGGGGLGKKGTRKELKRHCKNKKLRKGKLTEVDTWFLDGVPYDP